jgi:hypothetical protein
MSSNVPSIRIPTVFFEITGPEFALPNISAGPSSAAYTSDGLPIGTSPYLLAFGIDPANSATLGAFFRENSFALLAPITNYYFTLYTLRQIVAPQGRTVNGIVFFANNLVPYPACPGANSLTYTVTYFTPNPQDTNCPNAIQLAGINSTLPVITNQGGP